MHGPSEDRRVVSIAVLVAALRRESVPDAAVLRVLAEVLGVDEATARAHADGPPPPPDVDALHALLAAAQERRDWVEVVALLGRIVELEADPARRARYLYTMATIQRVDLADTEAALETLDQVLDHDPSTPRAFETLCGMLTAQQDWKRLERAHRKMIVRVRGQGDAALESSLYLALGRIYRDHLDHREAAGEAFKLALRLRPDDAEILAALEGLDSSPA